MNIGILGAIGVDDMGDVVMLQAATDLIRNIKDALNKKTKFTIFSLDKELANEQIKKIGIKANIATAASIDDLTNETLNSFSFSQLSTSENIEDIIDNQRYIDEISDCDALFFIGGGYFNKYWGDKLISTFILPIALGYRFKKPIYISGVNLGPFSDEQIKRFKGLFKNVDTLILRDRDESLNTLERLGGTNGNLILGSDDILPRWYNAQAEAGDTNIDSEGLRYAVLQLHHWAEMYSDSYIKLYQELANFFNKLLDNKEIDRVYFLPFSYYKGVDYECGRRLKTFINDREEYIVLEPTKDYIFMRQLISNAEFIIGSRYHPVVFGMGEQVPTLGIYVNDLYKLKISGAFQVVEMSTEHNMVYINNLTSGKLMDWYTRSKDIDHINKQKLKEIIDHYDKNRRNSITNFISGLI